MQHVYPVRGFGFIRCSESAAPGDIGQDFFFHRSGLVEGEDSIYHLEEGGHVEFEPHHVAKGKRAEQVRVLP